MNDKAQRVEDIKGSVDVASTDQLDMVNAYAVEQVAKGLSKLYEDNTAETMIAMLESIVADLGVDKDSEEVENE